VQGGTVITFLVSYLLTHYINFPVNIPIDYRVIVILNNHYYNFFKADNVKRIVNYHLFNNKNPEYHQELKEFSKMADHQDIRFSPYGVFTLNNSMILKVRSVNTERFI